MSLLLYIASLVSLLSLILCHRTTNHVLMAKHGEKVTGALQPSVHQKANTPCTYSRVATVQRVKQQKNTIVKVLLPLIFVSKIISIFLAGRPVAKKNLSPSLTMVKARQFVAPLHDRVLQEYR